VPGTYTTVFQPKIVFTTDASWISNADTADFVQFERPDGHGSIDFMHVDKVFDPERAHKLMAAPNNLIDWIVKLPGVRVLAGPKAVTIDGVKGTEIDVEATKDASTVYCKDPCVQLWPLRGLMTDWVTRIVVIRLHSETVEMAACCDSGAGFAALAKDFDTIIRSVTFG
jgi:hypothetical protein